MSTSVQRDHRVQPKRRSGVIHQPYFLPWLGYFSKLAFADVFVVLDNVNFVKQHYLDRTRIIDMHGQSSWLSLPTGQNLGVPIAGVALHPPDSRTLPNLIETIRVSYSKALCFQQEWPPLFKALYSAFEPEPAMLLDVDLALIQAILKRLAIRAPEIVFASSLSSSTDATDRIIEICQRSGVTDLVLGGGRSHAVHDFERIEANDIALHSQHYLGVHPTYFQTRRRRADFAAGLSVIDAIFNCGADAVREFVSHTTHVPIPMGDASPLRGVS